VQLELLELLEFGQLMTYHIEHILGRLLDLDHALII